MQSAISEHLINNPFCEKNYMSLSNFTILRKCFNYVAVIKNEGILIKLLKPKLCKKK